MTDQPYPVVFLTDCVTSWPAGPDAPDNETTVNIAYMISGRPGLRTIRVRYFRDTERVLTSLGNELAEAVAHLESVLVRRPRRD